MELVEKEPYILKIEKNNITLGIKDTSNEISFHTEKEGCLDSEKIFQIKNRFEEICNKNRLDKESFKSFADISHEVALELNHDIERTDIKLSENFSDSNTFSDKYNYIKNLYNDIKYERLITTPENKNMPVITNIRNDSEEKNLTQFKLLSGNNKLKCVYDNNLSKGSYNMFGNVSKNEFEEFLKEKDIQIIKKVDTVYYVNSGLIINSEEFKTGKIIAQDASSYLAAKNLEVIPNELVLDICAAPGGKTAVLAENMENRGEIIAIDIHQHKIKLIDTNMKKLGIDIVKATVMDARNVNKQGRKFDKILVDVPCSGYGVIRKKPEILYSKNRENIEELAKLQLEILNSAADILKDGGELIYSTCTITDEENTNNIEKFLKEREEFKVEKLYIPKNVSGDYDSLGGFCINYKEEIMDNFYIIKLKKGEKC